jgi:hypothetical protein
MTVASHEMKGKIQPLKQTFVIMKPRSAKRTNGSDASVEHNSKRLKPNDDGGDDENKMEVDGDIDVDVNATQGYEVAGVVTSKVLFDRYPKSIMR